MQKKLAAFIRNESMKARAIRGTALSVVGFGSLQFIRLVSNLILTRLLFPEAFGLMALVFVFISALEMFSDLGTHTAIVQSKRGDDPAFLNTAWTVQIIRGIVLWLVACLLTYPLAAFYEQDALKEIMPILALILVINSFKSTRISTANRHLKLGRVTALEVISQLITTTSMAVIALWWPSVWALVIGTLTGAVLTTILSHRFLVGIPNRLFWDKSAFSELFYFGKYIFFSTIAGYIVLQGDRLILGKFISLEELAIYTIAVMFGSLPQALGSQIGGRVLLPLYRQRPPQESDSNFRAIGRARVVLMLGLLAIIAIFASSGSWLITFLYDERYHAAGPILSLICISIIPSIFLESYSQLLLANGNSRKFLLYISFHAFFKISLLLVLVPSYGVVGVIVSVFVASVLAYPFVVYQIRPYRGWYPLSDVALFACGVAIIGLTFWVSPVALEALQNGL